MRFLLDANLSPRLCGLLGSAGHDTVHVADVGLLAATDEAIFEYAARHGLVIITADTDFSMLLALLSTAGPSVVLLRRVAELRPDAHGAMLNANLPLVIDDLAFGAGVSLSPSRLAVRRLPMQSGSDVSLVWVSACSTGRGAGAIFHRSAGRGRAIRQGEPDRSSSVPCRKPAEAGHRNPHWPTRLATL